MLFEIGEKKIELLQRGLEKYMLEWKSKMEYNAPWTSFIFFQGGEQTFPHQPRQIPTTNFKEVSLLRLSSDLQRDIFQRFLLRKTVHDESSTISRIIRNITRRITIVSIIPHAQF